MLPSYRSGRSFAILLLVSLFSVTMIVGCGQNESTNAESQNQENQTSQSNIALKVGSETLTKAEFNKQLDQKIQQFKQRPRMKQQLQKLPEKQQKQQMKRIRSRMKQQMARRLETKLLLNHHMKKAGISVSDEEVQKRIDELKKSQPQLQQMLKQQGRSIEDLKDRIRKQLKIQNFVEERVGEIEVTEEEARKYYQNNKQEFSQKEQVKARHILVKDTSATGRQKAQDLKNRLDQGEDFGKVAREESEGPSARKDGSLGYITRDKMVKPFSESAFSLGVGEISDPVKTRYGWHLIKVTDRKEASQQSYESVSDTIVERVKQKKKKEKFQQILKQLKEETKIVNNVASAQPRQPRPARPQGGAPGGPGQ
ncbi:MAG: peptidylprolyl isomerase [bacterium]